MTRQEGGRLSYPGVHVAPAPQQYAAIRPAGRLSWPTAQEPPKAIEAPKYADYQFAVASRPSGPQVPPTFTQPVKSQAVTDGERMILDGVVTGRVQALTKL